MGCCPVSGVWKGVNRCSSEELAGIDGRGLCIVKCKACLYLKLHIKQEYSGMDTCYVQ